MEFEPTLKLRKSVFLRGFRFEVLDQETQGLEKVDCPSYVLQHNVLSDPNDKDVVYEDCASGTFAQCP